MSPHTPRCKPRVCLSHRPPPSSDFTALTLDLHHLTSSFAPFIFPSTSTSNFITDKYESHQAVCKDDRTMVILLGVH